MNYSKHPQKIPIQEFHKTTSQDFGPSIWAQTILLHLAENAETYYSKHPQKIPIQEFHKTTSQDFGPSFVFFCRFTNPQHNGLHVTTLLFIKKSIKVRSQRSRRRTREE